MPDPINILYGCGEYVPGTREYSIIPPPPPPPPPKTITIFRGTNGVPPLPGGPNFETTPPRDPFPGGPGGPGDQVPPNSGAPGGPATPGGGGFGGPTTPGPPAPPGGNGFGGPTTPGGPATPGGGGFGGPTTPSPTAPPGGGGGGPRVSGPTTPGPTEPPGGRGGGNSNEPDDPLLFEPDPLYRIRNPRRLEDELGGGGGGGGGGGETDITFTTATTVRLDDVIRRGSNQSNPVNRVTLQDRFSPPQSAAANSNQNNTQSSNQINLNISNNSDRSAFSNSYYSNNNMIYDPIYNILDYRNSPTEFVQNNKYLSIFSNRVAKEVSYLINTIGLDFSWEEKYITGLTIQKLNASLNSTLLNAFDSIVDINGILVGRQPFVLRLLSHLLKGTLDEFNPSYYIDLAATSRERPSLTLNPTSNEQSKRNAILSILSSKSNPANPNSYDSFDKIEVARLKFLLTDLESTFDVETIDGTEYQLQLEDAGVEVDYAQSLSLQENANALTSDYVPPGEGDGYYYKIETVTGEVLPLLIDNKIEEAYFVGSDTRRLLLNILNVDHAYRFTSTLTYDDSEFGSGYLEEYTASALYFKVDLRTISSEFTNDSFVENISVTYTKLEDQSAILDHSKTYGAKAIQMSIMYDDPFFQYASRSGEMALNMNDVTFRQFTPKRTPSGNAIITRTLPDVIILYPVSRAEDNPLGAYSEITDFSTSVERTVYTDISFNLREQDLSNRLIPKKSIWQSEGLFQYGLVGISDTENIYYPFSFDYFPDKYTISGRGPKGHLLHTIVERLKAKYTFTELNWFDLYRRLTTKEFSSLMYDFPAIISQRLNRGSLGFRIKDVLYRNGEAPNNLAETDPSILDTLYLDGQIRDNDLIR